MDCHQEYNFLLQRGMCETPKSSMLSGPVVFFLLQNNETIGSSGWKSTGLKGEAALWWVGFTRNDNRTN